MTRVITYGTFDLLHRGHVRLLERARALGDYLIVGVTADDFDKARGKINVQQSLMERVEAVRSTGLADEIIIEEYEGQKIDDIQRMDVDIFTVGSDWTGKFDYLSRYCQVIYLDRTDGVSSSELRTAERKVRMGLIGESAILEKFARECACVNGVEMTGIWTRNEKLLADQPTSLRTPDLETLLSRVDAVYIASHPTRHYEQVKQALQKGKHVLCESPIAMTRAGYRELRELARKQGCVLMDGIKTAYAMAYSRLLLLIKSGKIGEVVSVDATCTTLRDVDFSNARQLDETWNSLTDWGPQALLPVFQLLGIHPTESRKVSFHSSVAPDFDLFTKIDLLYPRAVASIKVGNGVKSEGELIISGTKGYAYVPAPWWKTDYFELRFERQEENRRYYYPLEGEGIRYEIVAFVKGLLSGRDTAYIPEEVSEEICAMMEQPDAYRWSDTLF